MADKSEKQPCRLCKFVARSAGWCLGLVLLGAACHVNAESPSEPIPGYHWTCVTRNGPFAARDGAGALTFHGKMWLLGGWNPSDKAHFPRICNNEVWSSTDGAQWTLEKPNTFLDARFDPTADWEGRHTAGYVVFEDKMWILGGDPIQGHYQFDVWNSADGKKWKPRQQGSPPSPGARACSSTRSCFATRSGSWAARRPRNSPPADEVFYRDVWNTSDGIHWNQVKLEEPCWPQRGMIGGSVVFNDRMWILGGGTYDTPERAQATVLQRCLEFGRRRALAAAPSPSALASAAVSRRRRLRWSHVGHGGLEPAEPQRRVVLIRRRALARSTQHALGLPAMRPACSSTTMPSGWSSATTCSPTCGSSSGSPHDYFFPSARCCRKNRVRISPHASPSTSETIRQRWFSRGSSSNR